MNKLLMILTLMMSFTAMADDKNANYQLGDDVRAWTNLQKSGEASNKTVQPMPGEIADKVYDRYLKSFDYAIPQYFNRENFVAGGGSGGSGGQ